MMAYWLFAMAPLVPAKVFIFERYTAKTPSDGQPSNDGGGGGGGGDAPPAAAGGAPAAAAAAPSPPGAPSWAAFTASDAVVLGTGVIAGFASGLLGIGGGTIVTPMLALATGMPQVRRGGGGRPLQPSDGCAGVCSITAPSPCPVSPRLLAPALQVAVLGTSLAAMVAPSLVGLVQHYRWAARRPRGWR
jgi:hypothetical protein